MDSFTSSSSSVSPPPKHSGTLSPHPLLQSSAFTATQRASAVVAHLFGPSRQTPSPMQGSASPPIRYSSPYSSHSAQDVPAASADSSSPAHAPSSGLPYSTPTPVSPHDPHLLIRRACPSDFYKGHVSLLSQLTDVGQIDAASYAARLDAMNRCGDVFTCLVIEDTSRHVEGAPPGSGLIIASATLVMELKFVHGCGAAGHIEDVVVRDGYRGKNLGIKIVTALHEVGKYLGCYKIMLDCKESNASFYAKMGYTLDQVHMRLNLK